MVDVRDVDVVDVGTGPGVCANTGNPGYAGYCSEEGQCDAGVHWNTSYPERHVGTCGVSIAYP